MLKELQKNKSAFQLILISCVAVFLYLFNINYSDFWVDETFTQELVKKPMGELLSLLAGDFHPPLYFIGLKLFTSIFGESDFIIRSFSVLGALLTLVLSYTVGQRIFGKTGALYFLILLLPLPMLASNANIARMYTWAMFFTTGIFLFACLFIKSGKTKDLILLGAFSLCAVYTHYYCIIATFWTNIFVLSTLLLWKKPHWKSHLIMGSILIILFLPWLFVLIKQISAANEAFWIPPPSIQILFECYTFPYAIKFELINSSYLLLALVYIITLITAYTTYTKSNKDNIQRIALSLSLIIYNATVLTALVVSLFSQPILYPRYVMTIVSMLVVPLSIFFIGYKNQQIKYGLLILIFSLSSYISIKDSFFSYGPYKQAIEHHRNTHPEIKKIVYQSEVSLAPMMKYDPNDSLQHCWLNNENSIYYTNLKVFDRLQMVNTLDDMLINNEVFCLAGTSNMPLNLENAKMIQSNNFY